MSSKSDKRRKQILTILSEVPISSTQQLADTARVSNETIRKDLEALANDGLIVKVHGGVALAGSNMNEAPFNQLTTTNIEVKQMIARQALALIQEGDIILLESCTTNLVLARELTENPGLLESLIIITNSFHIVSVLEGGRKCKKIFFLGGWINPRQYSALGHQTAALLRDFHVSKAFLSGAALSSQFILTGYCDDAVKFQKNALSAAQKVILMIDSRRFEQTAIFTVARLAEVDYLITDQTLTRSGLAYIKEHGIRYIKA